MPVPSRTAGNQRLYSERDIATISWLRDQTDAKVTISQAIALLRSHRGLEAPKSPPLPSLVDEPSASANGAIEPDAFRAHRVALGNALVALDGIAADRIVEEALSLSSVENVCLHVLQGALEEIGTRWEHGSANIASEHFASAYVQRKFGALFNHSNPDEGRGPIVAACPEGELHEIGLLLSSLFLSRRGYRVVFLGANLPQRDLIEAVERTQPALVMLAASHEASAWRIADAIPELKASGRNGAPTIGYGGGIFNRRPELQREIDGVFLGRDAQEVVAKVERLVRAQQN